MATTTETASEKIARSTNTFVTNGIVATALAMGIVIATLFVTTRISK